MWPKGSHEITKEPFAEMVEWSREPQYQDFECMPPSPPSRTEIIWEDDNVYSERELSEEEFAEATANYEKAREEWNRTKGHLRQKAGPDVYKATFRTASGATARMITTEDAEPGFWYCVESEQKLRKAGHSEE